MDAYQIWTDGSAVPNPGDGGWGVVILKPDGSTHEIFGGEKNTTNNRMEITAAIKGLTETPEGSNVIVWIDSEYVRNGITSWMSKWVKNGWKTSDGKDVKNRELWESLHKIASKRHIEWKWIKGHADNANNNRADELASMGRTGTQLLDPQEPNDANKPSHTPYPFWKNLTADDIKKITSAVESASKHNKTIVQTNIMDDLIEIHLEWVLGDLDELKNEINQNLAINNLRWYTRIEGYTISKSMTTPRIVKLALMQL